MARLRVKICGITIASQGRAIAELGATALGFICAKQSPRYVTPEQIRAIVAELPQHTITQQAIADRIGVFVNASLDMITQTVAIGDLNGVQLHGDEAPEFCHQLRQQLPEIELIKALRIPNPQALALASCYETVVNTLLLDAYHPHLVGGTGQVLDWQALQQFQPKCPWFLAGGLTPENVLTALQLATPTGIDLSSGVEQTPGNKELAKVARLFEQLGKLPAVEAPVYG
jgi:phosphoribosylanthranilate isomerase